MINLQVWVIEITIPGSAVRQAINCSKELVKLYITNGDANVQFFFYPIDTQKIIDCYNDFPQNF